MGKFNINFGDKLAIDFDEDEIKNKLRLKVQQETTRQINQLFIAPTQESSYSGEGYRRIATVIESRLQNPKTEEIIQKFIDENFERILQETLTVALSHLAKKVVFQATNHQFPRDGINKLSGLIKESLETN